MVLGLDNSGKTNLCRKVKEGSFIFDHIETKTASNFEI